MKTIKYFYLLVLSLTLFSCGTVGELSTNAVAYQSVRTVEYKPEIPNDATIALGYSITAGGSLIVIVKNLTNEIMIIDQTKSFFVDSNGLSTSYYDPTVRTTSNTSVTSNTAGATVNLGAIGGALGIGGVLGGVLRGVNVGGASTVGSSTTETTYFADQPQISLAPKSHGAMSKNFSVSGVGIYALLQSNDVYSTFTPMNSCCKFSVCISYSIDGGQTFDKIVTPFYVNSIIVSKVTSHGKVNEALRKILSQKSDAIHESWWLIKAVDNKTPGNNYICQGALTDYK